MLYCAKGGSNSELTSADIASSIFDSCRLNGHRKRILIIPPDITRPHSYAHEIMKAIVSCCGDTVNAILPALGTHHPLSGADLKKMYPGVAAKLFKTHNMRKDLVKLGEVDAGFVSEISGGTYISPWPCEVNSLLVNGKYDCIISIGQVVPHEVSGMSNFRKNIFVGIGGKEGIDKSHYLSAVYGIERTLGNPDSPVIRLFERAATDFLAGIPIFYILTVVTRDHDRTSLRGLFIGDDAECFHRASALARSMCITQLPEKVPEIVAYLPREEYRSMWLGNKAIYRARMAVKDGGKIIIIAPGIRNYSDDPMFDKLIGQFGYCGRDVVCKNVAENGPLAKELAVAAHLIHGSTEGRFVVEYCPGSLDRKQVERVGFTYGDLTAVLKRLGPKPLEKGFHTLADGSTVYSVGDPGLGLWIGGTHSA